MVLLGDSKVGKTSIVRRLVEETFNLKYESTQNFDTVDKKWYLNNGTCIVLQIWDTAGLDRYNSLQDSYFNGASGFVVIFDYQNKESFENIRSWITVIKTKAKVEAPTIVVLGNKCDIKGFSIQVKSEDVDKLLAEY